jgi:23S rRNA pseudouridine2605 synthase
MKLLSWTGRANHCCFRLVGRRSGLSQGSQQQKLFPSSPVEFTSKRFTTSYAGLATTAKNDSAPDSSHPPTRLSKLLASHAGISRREAERWIREGEVTLAGQVVRSPQQLIEWESVAGTLLKARGKAITVDPSSSSPFSNASENETKVWLVHKLSGELVSDSDPHDRPCLMQRLAKSGLGRKKTGFHLKSIGRLDMNTSGLILVTNDGQYAREMEVQPLHRTYRVRAHGRVFAEQLARRMRSGVVTENGIRYAPMKIVLDDEARRGRSSTNTWFQVTCTQGKNRQIRNVFEHLGCKYVVVLIASCLLLW